MALARADKAVMDGYLEVCEFLASVHTIAAAVILTYNGSERETPKSLPPDCKDNSTPR